MADDADYAADQQQRGDTYRIDHVRRQAAAIPIGEPGECENCGEEMPRLVGGHCAPCRDGRRRRAATIGRGFDPDGWCL